jgi:hypothetical protein
MYISFYLASDGRLHPFSLFSHFQSISSRGLCIHDVHEFGLQGSATDQETVNVWLGACVAIQFLKET